MAVDSVHLDARRRRVRSKRRRGLLRLALLVTALAAAVVALTLLVRAGGGAPSRAAAAVSPVAPSKLPPVPDEVRGVHVTMSLASVPGKLDEYLGLRRDGLNTVELDVKDESGRIGFTSAALPLATAIGATGSYYDPAAVVRKAKAAGVYLVGRVVCFEDPTLARAHPELAIHRRGGGLWTSRAGLAWANPYDPRVWRYVVDAAVAAARAGFDEIQLDYVRFPSDGDLSSALYPVRRPGGYADTVEAFVRYAARRLRPYHVRISLDVFGLAATREIGIGQHPARLARLVDGLSPMVYPSHFGGGEYGITSPEAYPGATVDHALRDFDRVLAGTDARLVPWIQDFSLSVPYSLQQVREQIRAARSRGVDGFLLWNPFGSYTDPALAPLRLTAPELAFAKLAKAVRSD